MHTQPPYDDDPRSHGELLYVKDFVTYSSNHSLCVRDLSKANEAKRTTENDADRNTKFFSKSCQSNFHNIISFNFNNKFNVTHMCTPTVILASNKQKKLKRPKHVLHFRRSRKQTTLFFSSLLDFFVAWTEMMLRVKNQPTTICPVISAEQMRWRQKQNNRKVF